MLSKDSVIHVIGPTFGVDHMFMSRGYSKVFTDRGIADKDPDVVVWTGGADISPNLYKQHRVAGTYPNEERDRREIEFWNKYRDKKKIGICRGAQLLSVLNGGSMIQDVNNHMTGTHPVITHDGQTIVVSTVHHQMIVPTEEFKILAWTNLATSFRDDKGYTSDRPIPVDPEVIWIQKDKALCFQGHPEFGPQSCEDYFFKLVNEVF